MDKGKTILVVDDHPLFREGVVSLLSKKKGYEVVGEALRAEEGIQKARELKPDLVIMDISLPDMNGIDATSRIRTSLPETKVVILSMHSKIEFITDAFKAGASGYVTKDSASEKLIRCLEIVSEGEYYMDFAVSQNVIKNLLSTEYEKGVHKAPAYDSLTSREQEVLKLYARGLSTKEIGQRLFISRKTVENHRASIFSKLNIHSTMELVRYAARHGLIDVDLWKE